MRLLFWLPKRNNDFQLSIGATSPPDLSNAIMYSFDSEIFEYCSGKKIAYTRYADDMALSMRDRKMRGEVLTKIESVLNSQFFPKLKLIIKKRFSAQKPTVVY